MLVFELEENTKGIVEGMDDISISSVGVNTYPKEGRHVWLIPLSIPALRKEPSVYSERRDEAGGRLDG